MYPRNVNALSAKHWDSSIDATMCVNKPEPEHLVGMLERLATDKELRERYSAKAATVAGKECEPAMIQQCFLRLGVEALASGAAPSGLNSRDCDRGG
jgi:hypothetical protein